MTSCSFLVTYGLVHVAVVVVRRADPEGYDPAFEMPGLLYPAVSVPGVAMAGVVIPRMEPLVILVGTGIVLLGAGWYAVYARDRVIEDGLFDTSGGFTRNLMTAFPGTTPATGAGNPYRVVVGVANPETQHGLLRLGAATADAHENEGAPELVAVNVIEAESVSERNIASDRLDDQRALLENARDIATEMDVALRTVGVVAAASGLAGSDTGGGSLAEAPTRAATPTVEPTLTTTRSGRGEQCRAAKGLTRTRYRSTHARRGLHGVRRR